MADEVEEDNERNESTSLREYKYEKADEGRRRKGLIVSQLEMNGMEWKNEKCRG